ncbi:MAG: energy-coupling factor ABC transporter permease [Planctomycetes bacterium]|nr:energy-coupling factor ABC transporter permease [Planctomycetota bacterium]
MSDGTPIPALVLLGSGGAAVLLTWATLPRLAAASPARVAAATSVFFVASQLAFPVPPTSVHLSFLGLAGVLLGRAAFPAVLVGLVLQRALLGHGGWTTLPLNACTMGLGALVAGLVFHAGGAGGRILGRPAWRAATAAALGTATALGLYGAALLSAGDALRDVAWVCVVAHAPVLVVETLLTAQAAAYLARVQPTLLAPPPAPAPSTAAGAPP